MKKTLLVSAIVSAMASAPVLAATVFDKDGTKVDAYGRVQIQLETNDQTSAIKNDGSRFGFKVAHKISDDMAAYGNAEFRYDADERNQKPMDIRNTYFGVKGGFGDVMVGNFDSLYYQAVTKMFDVPEFDAYLADATLDGGSKQSRGDSIAYQSPSFSGFKMGVQVKHQAEAKNAEGVVTKKEATNLQGYASYSMEQITFNLGINQDNDDMGGKGENIIGASVKFDLSKELSLMALYETQKDNRDTIALGGSFNYGKGDVYGFVARNDFDAANKDNLIGYTLGANYKITKPFYVFAEFYDNDQDNADNWTTTVGGRLSF